MRLWRNETVSETFRRDLSIDTLIEQINGSQIDRQISFLGVEIQLVDVNALVPGQGGVTGPWGKYRIKIQGFLKS